jgi:hypothetical protein
MRRFHEWNPGSAEDMFSQTMEPIVLQPARDDALSMNVFDYRAEHRASKRHYLPVRRF